MKENLKPPIFPILIGFLLAVFGILVYESGQIVYEDHVRKVGTFWWKLFSSPPNEIGDTLAGIFGTFAFLAAAVAVTMQSFELRAQREELSLTRAEFEKMNEGQDTQNFDRFFFELVETHNQIVNAISPNTRKITTINGPNTITQPKYDGRSSFELFFNVFAKSYSNSDKSTEKSAIKSLNESQDLLYEKHNPSLGHYFRFLYNSCRVIDESTKGQLRHKRLFRALLSDDELLIIFYNSLTPRGYKMLKYCKSFDLFDNLPKDRLLSKLDLQRYEKMQKSIAVDSELVWDGDAK